MGTIEISLFLELMYRVCELFINANKLHFAMHLDAFLFSFQLIISMNFAGKLIAFITSKPKHISCEKIVRYLTI